MAAACRACWTATSNKQGNIALSKRVEASGFGPFRLPAAAGKKGALLVAACVKYLAFLPNANAVQLVFQPGNAAARGF